MRKDSDPQQHKQAGCASSASSTGCRSSSSSTLKTRSCRSNVGKSCQKNGAFHIMRYRASAFPPEGVLDGLALSLLHVSLGSMCASQACHCISPGPPQHQVCSGPLHTADSGDTHPEPSQGSTVFLPCGTFIPCDSQVFYKGLESRLNTNKSSADFFFPFQRLLCKDSACSAWGCPAQGGTSHMESISTCRAGQQPTLHQTPGTKEMLPQPWVKRERQMINQELRNYMEKAKPSTQFETSVWRLTKQDHGQNKPYPSIFPGGEGPG